MGQDESAARQNTRLAGWCVLWILQILWFVLILFIWNIGFGNPKPQYEAISISLSALEVLLGIVAILIRCRSLWGLLVNS